MRAQLVGLIVTLTISTLATACGDDGHSAGEDPPDAAPEVDAPNSGCQSIPATGQFVARAGNPRLLAGNRSLVDGKLDLAIADPDVHFDPVTNQFEAYYQTPRGTSYTAPELVQTIRHVSSPDKTTWSIVEEPALVASSEPTAWDHVNTETPTVVYNPDAPADRRYLMMYSGANGTFPYPGYAFANYAIGAAFSSDGVTFTRVAAADSPHQQAGLVLTGADAYPAATGAIVADPELAFVNGTYHLFFSSFACIGADCAMVQAYGVGHATSTDGVHWTVAEAPVRTLLRASASPTTGGAQPSVIYDATHCRWELWLVSDQMGDTADQPIVFNNMAGVFRAESSDGVTWSTDYTRRDFSWNSAAPRSGEHLGLLTGPDVAAKGNGRLLVYVGFDDQAVPAGFVLPDRSGEPGYRAGVMTLDIATRDLP